eukprot:768629-Hanusia_phi.AAC.5
MEFEQGLIRFRREDRTTRYKSDETASSDKEISGRRKQGTRAGHRRELARKRAGRERGEGGVGLEKSARALQRQILVSPDLSVKEGWGVQTAGGLERVSRGPCEGFSKEGVLLLVLEGVKGSRIAPGWCIDWGGQEGWGGMFAPWYGRDRAYREEEINRELSDVNSRCLPSWTCLRGLTGSFEETFTLTTPAEGSNPEIPSDSFRARKESEAFSSTLLTSLDLYVLYYYCQGPYVNCAAIGGSPAGRSESNMSEPAPGNSLNQAPGTEIGAVYTGRNPLHVPKFADTYRFSAGAFAASAFP